MSRGIGIGFGMGIAIRPKKEDDPIIATLAKYSTWVQTIMKDYIYRINDHGIPYWRVNTAELDSVAIRLTNDPTYSVYYGRTDANWLMWIWMDKSTQTTSTVFSSPVRICFGIVGNSQVYATFPAKIITEPSLLLITADGLEGMYKRFESYSVTNPDVVDVFRGVIPYSNPVAGVTYYNFFYMTSTTKYVKIPTTYANVKIYPLTGSSDIIDIVNTNIYNNVMLVFDIRNSKMPTSVIDRLLKGFDDFFKVNVSTRAVVTITLSGTECGIPTGGANNVNILGIIASFAAAGKTVTISVRTI